MGNGEDDTPKTWQEGHGELKNEMAQINYILKGIAGMLKDQGKNKKKDDEDSNHSESELDEPQPKSKGKERNDDDRGLKLDIPEFNGDMDPEKFMDWIRQTERVFEYKGYDDEKQFKVAILKLTKYASLWYENLKKQRKKTKKPKIESWEKLKKHLMKRFLPKDYEQENYLKLQSLSQEGLSVTDYIKEFERMSILCDLDEKEELRVARFIKGLTPLLSTRVEIQNYDGFDDVCRLALKFEKHDKARKLYSYKGGSSAGSSSSSYSKPSQSKPIEIQKEETKAKSVPVENRGSLLRRCFKCQGYGHIANECPQKRVLTIDELYDMIPNFVLPDQKEESVKEESDEEEVVHEVDPYSDEDREALVIRSLHSEATQIEDEQREQIFHTRCKVRNQICNLIIDSGSCTNVVSKELVESLKLATKNHPKPYKLHWLDGNNGVQVKEQALISLKLGPYEDEVYCDVIPMSACHILLGRPWQFDRKVAHDGRSNVYIVTKGKAKYHLNPLSPSKKKKPSAKGSLFLEASEVEEVLARGEPTFMLVVRELADSVNTHPAVSELLLEFGDVFPAYLPNGLPPKRGIEHQIDLIPGAPLPNKPAYRCNPEETKELQRQVQELIDRGYVQESLSPCAVPALLVPKKDGTWRMCIDSRSVNNITIKYRFPMPRLDDMLDELSGSCVF